MEKKALCAFLLVMVAASFGFADMSVVYNQSVGNIEGLGTVLNMILGFFRSNYMKAIVSVALAGLAVGVIMNRGEPGMVKKFIPWIVGCVLLLSLQSIVEIVFTNTTPRAQ